MPKTVSKSKNSKKQRTGFRPVRAFSNWSKRKKIVVSLVSSTLIAGVGVALLAFSSAAVPDGVYANWSWTTPAGGLTNLQHELKIEALHGNPTYFWAHNYDFINGGQGYIGLQSSGGRVNGTTGKTAVFSVFDSAIAASPSSSCQIIKKDFDGYAGRVGTSCRIMYNWVIGHTYQLTTRRDGANNLWGGWVKNLTTGVDTKIATITVPNTWQGIGGSTSMWTEYFGAHPSKCEDLPLSRVRFYKPRSLGGQVYGPYNTYFSTSGPKVYNYCRNSLVQTEGDSVVQQMGGFTNGTSPPKSPAPSNPAPAPTPNPTSKNPQPAPSNPTPTPAPDSSSKNPQPVPAPPPPAPTPQPTK